MEHVQGPHENRPMTEPFIFDGLTHISIKDAAIGRIVARTPVAGLIRNVLCSRMRL